MNSGMSPSPNWDIRRMLVSVILVAGLCVCSSALAQQGVYQLQSAKGTVEIRRQGKGPWHDVSCKGHLASPGDRIRTGANSCVHIVSPRGHRLVLRPETEVVLRPITRRSIWKIVIGTIMAIINGGDDMEVRGPAAVAAAEGTTFQVTAAEDGTTTLTVKQGDVRFFNDLGSVTVSTGQQSTARPGEAPSRPIAVDPATLMAWEANLRTLIIQPEYPPFAASPTELEEQLGRVLETLEEAPEDAEAHALAAELLLQLRRTDEALEHAREAITLDATAQSHAILGTALLQAGRPDEAIQHLQEATKGEPDNTDWKTALAVAVLGDGESKRAIALLREAAQLEPKDPAIAAYLAAAYLRSGDAETADAALKATDMHDHYLVLVFRAYSDLALGREDMAVAAAKAAVNAEPRSARVHAAAGAALFFSGKVAEAQKHLEKALQMDSLLGGAHVTLAKVFAVQGKLEDALQEARTAVALDPQSAPARSTLGLLLMLNDDPWRAEHQFQEALALDPALSEARTGWAQALVHTGRFQEALQQQRSAVALDTGSAAAHNNLAGLYASMGQMDRALGHAETAIMLQPEWGLAYVNVAIIRLEQNQYARALQAAETALRLGESSPLVHTVLARIYMRQGRQDRALEQLQTAAALDPDDPQTQFQLARLYQQRDRSRDAVRTTLTSVATDPSAMLETRRYARTEGSLGAGSDVDVHLDARHSGMSDRGRWSYFGSGSLDRRTVARNRNDDREELFGELLAGYDRGPDEHSVFFGSGFDIDAGLPGAVTPASSADPDDRRDFDGWEAIALHRHRISPTTTLMGKYSVRRSRLDFHNPGSLIPPDANPCRSLRAESTQHSPELRMDTVLDTGRSLTLGYSHMSEDHDGDADIGTIDPATGTPVFSRQSHDISSDIDTAYFEVRDRRRADLDLSAGLYWGKETGEPSVLRPKVAAVYRPDASSSLSALITPTFHADALELSPVQALTNPWGLDLFDFTEGGAAQTYELRWHTRGDKGSNFTASLARQTVDGLLVDVQDPATTGLPQRVLAESGDRWIADAAYEQSLGPHVSGRLWTRWQDTDGDFPRTGSSGTEWPYAPQWQAGARVDYMDENGYQAGLDLTWVGDRYVDAANTREIGSHTVLNLRLHKQQDLQHRYFIEVHNLTEKGYSTFEGYPKPGRAIYAGFQLRYK